MFMDLLILFIVLSVLFFILSIYLMENNPQLCIPFIMLGMIFTIIVTYGMWNVEVLYINYNASSGLTNTSIYNTASYGDPYSYIFMLFFFIYAVVFVRTGFNMWNDALQTKGEIDYKMNSRRRR